MLSIALLVLATSSQLIFFVGATSPGEWFREAVQFQREARYRESSALFQRVVDNVDTHDHQFSHLLPSAYYNLATAQNQLQHTDDAKANYALSIEHTQDRENSDTFIPAARALGILLLSSGSYASAQAWFQEVLGRQPWDKRTAFNLYSALKEQNKMDKALELLEFVTKLDPSYDLAAIELAEHFLLSSDPAKEEKLQRARSALRRISTQNPHSVQAKMTEVQVLVDLNLFDDAIELAKQVKAQVNGQDPGLLGQLCVAYRLKHNLSAAVQACQQAIRLSEQGYKSVRKQHHIARRNGVQQSVEEKLGFWVQLCYSQALLPQGVGSLAGSIQSAISACSQADTLLTTSVESNRDQAVSVDEMHRYTNFRLMVDSSLSVLHAANNRPRIAAQFAHKVLDADAEILRTSARRSPLAVVCSGGGAGSTSFMSALQAAGINVNAGVGSSYLKHRTLQILEQTRSTLNVGIDFGLYVVRSPRLALASIFRRQFQYLLGVQTNNGPPASTEAALAMRSFHDYAAYVARHHSSSHVAGSSSDTCALMGEDGCTDEAWDPLPLWNHLQTWLTPSSSIPRMIIHRERALEPKVFAALCDFLHVSGSVAGRMRAALLQSERATKQPYVSELSAEFEASLVDHYSPITTFIDHQLAEGFIVLPSQSTSQASTTQHKSSKKTKRKKKKRL